MIGGRMTPNENEMILRKLIAEPVTRSTATRPITTGART
jgi:hypothetical protein